MWKTVSLSDVCNVSIGKTPPRGDKRYWDIEKRTNNVWLSIADLSSSNDKYISDSKEYLSNEGASLFKSVPKNTLIMSFKLSIGKLAFTKCELRTNEAIAALSIIDESLILKEFLYHYLSSLNWDVLAGHDQKVKGKTLNKKKLNALEITLPPLAEQQRIVAKLDAAFSEIEDAPKKVNSQLESINLIFNAFSKKFIEQNESQLESALIGDKFNLATGGTPSSKKKEYYEDGTIRWLVSGDIHLEEIFDCEGKITEQGYRNSNAKYLPINSVLIALNGQGKTRGTVALLKCKATCNQSLVSIIPKNTNEITSDFLYFNLKNRYQEIRKITSDTGNDRRGLNMGLIKKINIKYPKDIKLQNEYVDRSKLLISNVKVFQETIKKKSNMYLRLKEAILNQELNNTFLT